MANIRKTIEMANTISSADALTTLKEAIAYYKTRQVEQTKRELICRPPAMPGQVVALDPEFRTAQDVRRDYASFESALGS